MWIYRVVHKFKDLEDGDYIYNVGDEFPRQDVIASRERIDELRSNKNKIGKPLIKAERKKKEE